MTSNRRVVCVAIIAVLVAAISPLATYARAEGDCEWLAGDFHVHTVYSHDAYGGPEDEGTTADEFYTLGWTPAQQGAIAESRGLDFIAITDHNNVDAWEQRDNPITGVDPYESGWGLENQVPGGDPLIWVPDYENSIGGHAQMHGATRVYDNSAGVVAVADALRADGGAFQINHPADMKWHDDAGNYEFPGFAPDSLEVWNIGTWAYQPPAVATNDHEFPIEMYDGFLDQGFHVAATGGSDNHWRSTTSAQGAGQPTTWVCATERTSHGIVHAVLANRTMISSQPPDYEGPVAKLFADGDGDGTFESMLGDTVTPGTEIRATVDGAEGATLRLVTDGGESLAEDTVDSPNFSKTYAISEDKTWVRAEIFYEDAQDMRKELQPLCDQSEDVYQQGLSDEENRYCENRLAMVAMTSPIYFEAPAFDPATTLTYNGDAQVKVGKKLTLGATLLDSEGAALAGQTLTFSFRGNSYSATTDAAGRGTVTGVKTKGPPGNYEVISSFAGTDTYDASKDSDLIVVTTGKDHT